MEIIDYILRGYKMKATNTGVADNKITGIIIKKEFWYKAIISIIFGLIGFGINFNTLNFPFGEFTATVLIGLLFPMLITQAWGWKYGLLSALAGGCQSMWWLWGSSNGYAIFFVVPPFTLWIIWHGICAKLFIKQKEYKWWLSQYFVEIPFRLLSTISLLTLARWAITFNPTPWAWGAGASNTIPIEFSVFVVIKQCVIGYVILLLVDILYDFKPVRSFFRLKATEVRGVISGGSFASKLITLILVVILLLVTVAYYNLDQNKKVISSVAKEGLVEVSRGTATQLDLLLAENQRTSTTLAGQPSVVLCLSASEEERLELVSRVNQTLQNFADTHPDFDAPGVLDLNGIVVASLAEELIGKDRSFRDYFQVSIQGESYVSDMLVGRTTGRPGVFLTNPVTTAAGEIIGINLVWLKADTIWSLIDDVRIGEEGVAYLIDQDGVIVAHPDRNFLYHSLGELTQEVQDVISETIRFGTIDGTNTPKIPKSLGMDQLADELVAAGNSGTYSYYSTIDNKEHVIAFTPMKENSWIVVVDVPEDQFISPLQELERTFYISVGAGVFIALFVSALLIGKILHPVQKLSKIAAAVKQGQPFELSGIEDIILGRDEIARFARLFGNMVITLRESEMKVLQIIEGNSTPIFVIDKEHTITHWNKACENLTGILANEIIGTKKQWIPFYSTKRPVLADLIVDNVSENTISKYYKDRYKKSVLVQGAYEVEEFFPYFGDKWLFFTAAPLKDSKNNIIGAIETLQDITERKRVEKTLNRLYDELENRVKGRTKELAVANEKLKEVDKLKSMFMASMSHELRTPLNSIIGFTTLLIQGSVGELNEEQRKQLGLVSTNSKHLLSLINDVIDISTIEAGKIDLDIQEFDISKLIGEIEEEMRPQIELKGINFVVKKPESCIVENDRRRVKQIIINYVSNAIKFTKKGEIKIEVKEIEDKLKIEVTDTGIGVKEKDMSKLFVAFSKIQYKGEERVKGTGLGLYIARKISESIGGKVGVESEFKKGSKFFLELPKAINKIIDNLKETVK